MLELLCSGARLCFFWPQPRPHRFHPPSARPGSWAFLLRSPLGHTVCKPSFSPLSSFSRPLHSFPFCILTLRQWGMGMGQILEFCLVLPRVWDSLEAWEGEHNLRWPLSCDVSSRKVEEGCVRHRKLTLGLMFCRIGVPCRFCHSYSSKSLQSGSFWNWDEIDM